MEFLQSFGPAGAAVAIVFLFLKYMKEEAEHRDEVIDRMIQSVDLNTKATSQNTKVSKQNYDFLKNLNGELKKAAKNKLEGNK